MNLKGQFGVSTQTSHGRQPAARVKKQACSILALAQQICLLGTVHGKTLSLKVHVSQSLWAQRLAQLVPYRSFISPLR